MHADSVLGKVDSSRKLAFANGLIKIIILYTYIAYPDATCMGYLPTFVLKITKT
jgi:hypothetical protein